MSFLQDRAACAGYYPAVTPIFQNNMPPEMRGEVRLPGVAPCGPDDWLRVDEAYAPQMTYRADLLARKSDAVLWTAPEAMSAAQELLECALPLMSTLGFDVQTALVTCPDGREVALDWAMPLWTLGHLVQEDLCILQKRGVEHVLTAAALCFPASWRLHEKAGRPLTHIHQPVAEYNADIARRVQRMFDGVKVGCPLWRFNRLTYANADLHQPFAKQGGPQPFLRSERQCILRLPRTEAVVFTIHTWVMPRAQFDAGPHISAAPQP